MRFFRGCLTGLCMVAITLTSQGQEKEKKDTLRLSVAEAQKYALTYNRSVQASKMDIEIARQKVWETTASGLPQFTATADYQHIFNVPEFSLPTVGFTESKINGVDNVPGFTQVQPFKDKYGSNVWEYVYNSPGAALSPKDNITFNFTLSQLVFSGEYIVGLQASRVYKELSDKSYVKSENTAKESVASSYYVVQMLTENINVLKENLKVIDKTYQDVLGMSQQGFTESTEPDQMKINKATVQTMITSLEGQRTVALKLLKVQMGVDFSQEVTLTEGLNSILEKGNFQYLNSSNFNVENSVDYEMMKTQESLMDLSLKREKSKFLPTVSAFYRHQQLLKEPILNFQPKDILGVSLNLPIFTSGQRLSTVKQAKLTLDKTRLNKEDVKQNLTLEFEKAKIDYQTAFSNFTTNSESKELSYKIYNNNIIKYKEGVITSMELTQSQNQYLTAQSNYFNAALNLLNAQAKIERIVSKYEKP